VSQHALQERVIERGGRLGLVAKGVSYVIVAVIAIGVALEGGQLQDRKGALQAVADESFGWALILLLAIGFVGYAAWRFASAFLDRENEGDDAKGLGKRAADLGKGLLYTGLAIVAVGILTGSEGGGSGEEQQATAFLFELPAGRWLVGAIGLAVIGAGLYNGFRAFTTRFRKDLRTGMMRQAEERWYTVIGVLGHLARAVVFLLIGAFLVRAAWQYDPDEAIGLDEALRKLAAEQYGQYLLGAVAFGLLAYGLFCFVQARYREV
jgi:hypothetical protein